MKCRRCQNPLSANNISGNCPVCLLEGALMDPVLEERSESVPDLVDYEIFGEIGRGGASVVYRARDRKLNRIVALKVLSNAAPNRRDIFARFRVEANAVARLEHPNIAPLYEAGQESGVHFLALRCFDRGSLADALRRRHFSLAAAARLVIIAARAVHFAHQRGVLHRDLKPSNLLLDEQDEPHIADFGLAKLFDDESSLTLSSSVLGTPNYMAPEQADGRARDASVAADIYSLGAILFELITGRPPFIGDTPLGVLRQVADDEPPRPRSYNKAIDRDLEAICLCCLEKEPARRYASAAELAEELEHWLRNEPVRVQPATPIERGIRWAQRRPLIATLAVTLVTTLIGGFAAVLSQWARAEREREATAGENYAASMTLAGQRIAEGDILEARAILVKQPARFRGWEWGRLMAQAHPELLHLRPYSSTTDTTLRLPVPWHTLSPDGTKLVFWGSDLQKRVIDTRNSSVLLQIGATNEGTGGAVFTADSRLLLSGGPGPGFTMWDTTSWEKVWQFGDTTAGDRRLVLLPGTSLLVTSTPTNFARLWNIETRRLVREFSKPTNYTAIWNSRDGSRIWFRPDASVASGAVEILDTTTGEVVGRVPQDGLTQCTILDGMWSVTIDLSHVVALWKIGDSTRRFQTAPYAEPRWAGFSPEKQRLAVLSAAGSLDFWDVTNRTRLGTPTARVTGVIFSNEEFLLTAAGDRFIRMWSWEGKELGKVPSGYAGGVTAAAATDDGRFFSAAWQAPTGISPLLFWQAPPQELSVDAPAPAFTGRLTADGKRLAVGHASGAVSVWNVDSGEQTALLQGHFRPVMDVIWSADGQRLFSASADRTIRVWDQAGHGQGLITNHSAAILRLAMSADGRRLASADAGGWLKVFDTVTLEELRSWRPVTNLYLWSIALNPDGKLLAAGEPIRQHGVWDTATGRKLSDLPVGENADGKNSVISVAFSPDGRELATCDYLGNLRFWDCATWELRRATKARGAAPSMVYTPDGSRLLLVVSDSPNVGIGESTVEVHDGLSGRQITSLGVENGHSPSLSFANGRLARGLISSSAPGAKVEVWDALPVSTVREGGSLADEMERFGRERAWEHARARRTPLAIDVEWVQPRSDWRTRATDTPDQCVDLTTFYNAHLETGWEPFIHLWEIDSDLRELPQGAVLLDGVVWDIRGLISLRRDPQEPLEFWTTPKQVMGIPVARKCQRLHFLHAFGLDAGGPRLVAIYRLHYGDGSTAELPAMAGVDTGDWRSLAPWSHASAAVVGWEGETPKATREGGRVRLFHRTYENPHPEKEIASFDFASSNGRVAPFLVALTVE